MQIRILKPQDFEVTLPGFESVTLPKAPHVVTTGFSETIVNEMMLQVLGATVTGLEHLPEGVRVEVGIEERKAMNSKIVKDYNVDLTAKTEILRTTAANAAGELVKLKMLLEPFGDTVADYASTKSPAQPELDYFKKVLIPLARAYNTSYDDILFNGVKYTPKFDINLDKQKLVESFKAEAETYKQASADSMVLLNRIQANRLVKNKSALVKVKQVREDYKEGDILLASVSPTGTLLIRHMYLGFTDVIDNIQKIAIDAPIGNVKLGITSDDVDKALATTYTKLLEALDYKVDIETHITRAKEFLSELSEATEYSTASSMLKVNSSSMQLEIWLLQDIIKTVNLYTRMIQKLLK